MADTATNRPGASSPPAKPAAPGPGPSGLGAAPGPERPGQSGERGDDWAKDVVDRLDEVIVKIRSNTTDRLVRLGRLVVLGLLAAIFGTAAGILLLIAVVRGLDVAIPGPVWEVYVLLGAIFSGAGLFLWSKKGPRPAKS